MENIPNPQPESATQSGNLKLNRYKDYTRLHKTGHAFVQSRTKPDSELRHYSDDRMLCPLNIHQRVHIQVLQQGSLSRSVVELLRWKLIGKLQFFRRAKIQARINKPFCFFGLFILFTHGYAELLFD